MATNIALKINLVFSRSFGTFRRMRPNTLLAEVERSSWCGVDRRPIDPRLLFPSTSSRSSAQVKGPIIRSKQKRQRWFSKGPGPFSSILKHTLRLRCRETLLLPPATCHHEQQSARSRGIMLYQACLEVLREALLLLQNCKINPLARYTIGPLSLKTRRSRIEKEGTDGDRGLLPPACRRSKSHALTRNDQDLEPPKLICFI